MKKIVITEFMDESAVQSLQDDFEVLYSPTLVDEPAALLSAVANADAVIVRNRTQVRGELLAAMKRALVIGRLGVGLDNIDVSACQARKIQVIPATGANALSVAEYVIATSMVLLRGVYQSSAEVAAGKWPRAQLSNGRETAGSTLGLVGFGFIGQLTARLAQGLGMQVSAFDPALKPDDAVWSQTGFIVKSASLDQVLEQSDVVSLHIPLTPETQNLMSAQRLARMKQGAVLINTARGGIVDEAALCHVLRSGHLGGAAIDVFQDEPLKSSSVFLDCPNLILTPHVAGVTQAANERVSTLIAQKVRQALEVSA